MHIDLKAKSLLTLCDYRPEEIRYLLDTAHDLKRQAKDEADTRPARFAAKSLAIIFEKRSTRTRCAFETAFAEEGGHPVFLSNQDIHLGAKETVEDTARVLGRMFAAIAFRGYKQETAQTLAEYAGIPVYNGLTDTWHPTQVLADLMTIEEEFGCGQKCKMVYLGDGRNNIARSLAVGCAKMGLDLCIAAPGELEPGSDFLALVRKMGKESGALIEVTAIDGAAIEDADVIYTDVWVSMGEQQKEKQRLSILRPYQVNRQLISRLKKKQAIFLHDLPAVRGNEVTDDVIDGERSRVWDQAENRKHTIKALMLATI